MQKFESRLKNNQNAVRRLEQIERESIRRGDSRYQPSRDQQSRRRDDKSMMKQGYQYEFDMPGERQSSYSRDQGAHHQNYRQEMPNRYEQRPPIQHNNHREQYMQPSINQPPMMVHQLLDQQRIYGNPEVLQTMVPQHYSLQSAPPQQHVQMQPYQNHPHTHPQNQQIYQQKYCFCYKP